MTGGASPLLYLVTDTDLCGGPQGVLATVEAALGARVDLVQLRDHRASTRQLETMARELVALCAPHDVPLMVDDRLDVALAAGAQGVHLGQSDLDPVAARRLADSCVGTGFHLGWSVSNLEQVSAARSLGPGIVDLFGIGPFRATATKPDAAAPLGLSGVASVAAQTSALGVPNVVIGGVNVDDVAPLIAAGAGGVAVVSAICGQADPGGAARALREALDAAAQDAGAQS